MRPRGTAGDVHAVLRTIISTHGPCRVSALRAEAIARGVSASAVKWTVANGLRSGLLVEAGVQLDPALGKHVKLIAAPTPSDSSESGHQGRLSKCAGILASVNPWAQPLRLSTGGMQ